MSYDPEGNLTNDGIHTYSWNARGELAALDSGSTANFAYDAFGRRASKSIFGVTTGWLYGGANPVQELSGRTPVANLVSGDMDEYFLRSESSGSTSFLADALGSTLALT